MAKYYEKEKQKNKTVFAENLKNQLSVHGITQSALAKTLGRSVASVNSWVNAVSMPSYEEVRKLAEYFSCSPDDLYSSPLSYPVRTAVRIPVVENLEMDKKGAFTEIIGYTEIPKDEVRKNDYFGFRVTGKGYLPFIFSDDLLLVLRTEEIDDVDALYLTREFGHSRIRRYVTQRDGFILTAPFPTEYQGNKKVQRQEMIYYAGKLKDYPEIRIFGKIVSLRRGFLPGGLL